MVRKSLLALVILGMAVSCKPKYESPEISAGEIDPARFVMIGGSQVAGYSDDALTFDGQENSLAALIAGQLSKVGGGTFNQPLVSESSVGVSLTGLSVLQLGYKTDCEGTSSLSPVRKASTGDLSIWNELLYSSSSHFGNYGVPGVRLDQLQLQGLSASNAFFSRFASSATASIIDDALSADPTFFALFAGLDELIAYAKSGATLGVLPSTAEFSSAYEAVLSTLTSNGAKGVIATLPDVTKMPYFTTIPYNGLALTSENADDLTLLNNIYNPLGYYFDYGNNPFMVVDSTANFVAVRQAMPGELLSLAIALDSVKCHQMGVLYPFRDEFVLDHLELNVLRAQIKNYNAAIRSLSDQFNLALVESEEFYTSLSDGFVYNGVTMSSKFVSGGAYSLDGIQLNARGNALLANAFFTAMNLKYKSKIPILNPMEFNGPIFP
ncbi:MAG: hypothetical protein LW688_12365 [Cryomorphaceae bacterium]|jgi:hypothetical protein|nr:hypothetical protein [Cryomorphaceae bacterium]